MNNSIGEEVSHQRNFVADQALTHDTVELVMALETEFNVEILTRCRKITTVPERDQCANTAKAWAALIWRLWLRASPVSLTLIKPGRVALFFVRGLFQVFKERKRGNRMRAVVVLFRSGLCGIPWVAGFRRSMG
jgi:hypothetical protein